MKTLLEILKNYKFDRKDFFSFLFFGALAEVVYLLFPKITEKIIASIETKSPINELYFWVLIFAISAVVFLWIHAISNYFSNKLWLVLHTKKNQYYRKKLFEKNYKDIIDIWTWKLITRLSDWVNWEVDIFDSLLKIFISAIFRWILVFIILFIYIPKLIFLVVFWIIILLILNYFFHNLVQKYSKIEQDLWEKDGRIKTRIIMENLIIRIFWKIDYELEKSKNNLDQIPKCWVIVDSLNNSMYKILEILLRFLEAWVYIILWTMVLKWGYSIAYLMMVIWYIWMLWWPLDNAVSNLNRINRQWEKYKKLQIFIDKPADIVNWNKNFIYKQWKIEFKNVDFSYDNEEKIFTWFNLNFLPWKKNALVWHSWGWKSTIVKIILRLFDYTKWEILIDWQDLKKLKIETLYKRIWYLPQDPAIFDWTIRENLEYSFNTNKKYSDEILWDALKKARIDDMVKKLKDQLESEIWEKWIKLSGWEKQRLAIARIFLKNPDIIILDEPTSSLDSISESKITKTLAELLKWKTSIIIAHRLQTIMKSDKIIVIEEWKIEGEWTHKELLEISKTYKKLVSLQNSIIE